MSTLKLVVAASAGLTLGAVVAFAQPPGLGTPITEADIKAWDIDVSPSGAGLPPGSGTAAQGAKIYAEKCAGCHQPDLTGGAVRGAGPLIGGSRPPLRGGMQTNATIVNFSGHSTTLFDYIRRAMPFQAPRTLSNDEVYALTAFLLAVNKVIPERQILNAETLPKVKMPNADNFIIRFPDRI